MCYRNAKQSLGTWHLAATRPQVLPSRGRPAVPEGQRPEAAYKAISPDFFGVLQIPLLQGRYFTDQDVPGAPPVVIPPVVVIDQGVRQQVFFRDCAATILRSGRGVGIRPRSSEAQAAS
jgi:MacB-like periplasmic core domain